MNLDRGGTNLLDAAEDDKFLPEARRLQIADAALGDVISAVSRAEHFGLIDPDRAQHVGAGPLHELQIIGVVDHAGSVGVLEIDAEREPVLAADESAAVGLVEVFRRDRDRCSKRRLPP